MSLDLTTPGFSLANARACLELSRRAYVEPATVSAQAHVLVEDRGNAIAVAFRGSQSIEDWILDSKAWRQNLGLMHTQVHYGFWVALSSVMAELRLAITRLDPKPLLVMGHSLGGALAVLFSFRWIDPAFPIHSVYTFGQPRVGDASFVRGYGDLAERTFRFVNEEDIVPRSPGWLIGYRHAGELAFLPSFGGLRRNPSLWYQFLSDAAGLYAAWLHGGPLECLEDHRIERYQARLDKLGPGTPGAISNPQSAIAI